LRAPVGAGAQYRKKGSKRAAYYEALTVLGNLTTGETLSDEELARLQCPPLLAEVRERRAALHGNGRRRSSASWRVR